MEKRFTTGDTYLSAYLCLKLETWPDMHLDRGRVLFSFPQSDALYKATYTFNSGDMVDIQRYSEALRRLRSDMYATKDAGGR